MLWALLIITTADASALPRVSWHLSHQACERQAEVELLHLAVTGRGVEHVECRAYRIGRQGR